MEKLLGFRSLVGNAPVVEILRRALEQNRLPHAMIFAGPDGVGKRMLARIVAQRLNCLAPQGEGICGTCRNCRKIELGTHPDVREIKPEGSFIRVEQVRSLIGEIAFQPFEARYRVVILDAADQMRHEAANSLLKTLEEPASRTFLILVTTNPYALLLTIRSRCRIVHFGKLTPREIEQYLVAHGKKQVDAELAALLGDGSLGAARNFDADKYREVRKQGLYFARLLLKGGSFTEASQVAAAQAKDKESFLLWFESVSVLLQDIYYAQVAPERIGQRDLVAEVRRIADTASGARVRTGIIGMKNLRKALVNNVNRQIALEALYLMQKAVDPD